MIAIMVAMAKNRVIGKDNKLPWNISEDLQNFKKLTSGNTILMGRKTYDSIGRPLPNRNNIVVSRSSPEIEGVDVCSSIEQGLEKAKAYGKDVFIVGGANIYSQTLKLADKIFLSLVKKEVEGDAFFPEFDEAEWEVEERKDFNEFEFIVYKRK